MIHITDDIRTLLEPQLGIRVLLVARHASLLHLLHFYARVTVYDS